MSILERMEDIGQQLRRLTDNDLSEIKVEIKVGETFMHNLSAEVRRRFNTVAYVRDKDGKDVRLPNPTFRSYHFPGNIIFKFNHDKKQDVKTGIELITQERNEQLTKHGRTVEDDVKYNDKEQLLEAMFLLMASRNADKEYCAAIFLQPPQGWNKDIWNKILAKPFTERLAIIGAFAAAEIDRLNYIETHE